jgi:integrase/recombinase XerD
VRIHAASDAYFTDLRARRRSLSLQKQTRRALSLLSTVLRKQHVHDLRRVDEAHLIAFARALQPALSLATQSAYLQRVKSLFAFLARTGILLTNPAADLRLPSSSPLPRLVLTERQAERLVTTPSPTTNSGRRDRALLEILYGTGIRRRECVHLDLDDVDLNRGTLLVRRGKGGRDRVVPIPKRAALALGIYLDEVRPSLAEDPAERALFLTAWRGRRLSEEALVARLRLHARAVAIPGVHLHALRHTCATHLLRGGASVRHVQAILGHRSLQTTARYTRVAITDLRQVLARCHPRERAERAGNGGRMSMEIRS